MLPEDTKLTKFHGIYQQDNRDERPGLEAAGQERSYSFMVRVGIPGGVCTPEQYLVMEGLASSHGNGNLKLTTRQAFQLHGVLKWNLKNSIQEINRGLMDTLAACGDVCRNVIASPNPFQSEVAGEVLAFAHRISAHLKPQTTAYHEIWLDKKLVGAQAHTDVEPLYGASYLPRKFKVAIAVPPMNDVDVFSHCLGYIAVVENGQLLGFNVSIGGGMGMTHGNTKTYPRLADLMGFCTVEQAILVGEAVMIVQRDHGDRVNRKHARLKYTLEDHGMDWYRTKVEAYCGFKLQACKPFKFESNHDRMGWSKGVDGNFHYGLFVENGRIRDMPGYPLKAAMRELAELHTGDFRLTANQNIIVGRVTPEQRPKIEALLHKYKIDNEQYSGLRLNSMACVALPTCALAMAESERYLPVLIDRLDEILTRNGLDADSIMIRMSGCPNGCSRPYMAEIAMVGKAPGAYNLYLGGGFGGNRLAKIYRESVGEEDILSILDDLITKYALHREAGERFGDYVIRSGVVAPTLAGRLFHETDTKTNMIPTYSGTTQIYW
jgi:sulfite reductase (NADPH) hemoprotein beta-component